MNRSSSHHLMAITGGSGAGKSWLAARLGRLLGEQACHLPIDNFYHDRSHLTPGRLQLLNFDTPRAIDWTYAERTLRACQAGRSAEVPHYDFSTHRRLTATTAWKPKPLVLVDGLSLLVHPRIRRLFTLKVYLDCPASVRLRRRLQRDIAERGRNPDAVRLQFRKTVVPMHERYVEPQQKWADLVLSQPFRKSELAELAERLWTLLTATARLRPWMRIPFHHELLSLLEYHDKA